MRNSAITDALDTEMDPQESLELLSKTKTSAFHHKQRHPKEIDHFDTDGNDSKSLMVSTISHLSASQLVTLSGAASGLVAGIVVCPLDVVKTRLQAQGPSKKSRGILREFTSIVQNEGFKGLYRGLVPITIGYLPTWTIYFTIYERAKHFYPQFMKRNFNLQVDAINHFLAALTAGLASSIAVNPIWVVKTRLMIQNTSNEAIPSATPKATLTATPKAIHTPSAAPTIPQTTHYKGTIDAFVRMYKEEGIRVFYSGLTPSLFGLLHVGIHFPVYEKLKDLTGCNTHSANRSNEDNDQINFKSGPDHLIWRLIFASSVAKMIASTITYPHEILRTRMQLRTTNEAYGTVHEGNTDKGKLWRTFISIYKKEGLKGYYAGYVVNLARTVPASAVTLVSFEYFKNYLLEVSGKSLT